MENNLLIAGLILFCLFTVFLTVSWVKKTYPSFAYECELAASRVIASILFVFWLISMCFLLFFGLIYFIVFYVLYPLLSVVYDKLKAKFNKIFNILFNTHFNTPIQ